MEENQIRGGGIGGRSILTKALGSPVKKAWPVKQIEKAFEVGQKRIIVEHDTVQQLRECD